MRIEPYQGGYRMMPSTGPAIQRARTDALQSAATCDSCNEPVKPFDVDRVELSSLQFASAASKATPAPGSLQRLREQLVAGVVNQPVDLPLPGGGNAVLNRAYFLSERSAADFNASAVGRAVDLQA